MLRTADIQMNLDAGDLYRASLMLRGWVRILQRGVTYVSNRLAEQKDENVTTD